MRPLQVDAVLFDLDGTLVDESVSYREAMRRTAELLLGEPVELEEALAVKHVPGLNNDWDATWALLERRRGGESGPPDAAQRRSPEYRRLVNVFQTFYLGSAVWGELAGEAPPFDWDEPLISREQSLVSRETLADLDSYPLGIATSRPRAEALMALRQHDLEQYIAPEVVVAREDAPREKPDPAPLLELARRLDCRHAVYVGDTVNDALAAAAAGMEFVAVGPLAAELGAYYRLHDVNGLPALLAEPVLRRA